jgi:DNA-binding MarR family transcriptional regulator
MLDYFRQACLTIGVKLPRSTFELLFRAARLVNERALARIEAARQQRDSERRVRVRLAHTALFPHITSPGIRLTALADRVGVTKQAIGPLVDDLEREGVVERIDDPDDARAKLIRWTKQGERALLHGLGALAELERDVANAVGKARLAALADTLELVIAAVEDR